MAALGNLVAGISHEINTPIGVSVTSASFMDEQVKDIERRFEANELKRSELVDFFSEFHKGFTILLENLRRSSDLIKNFKQVAVDQSSDEYREIDLHEYIDQIISSLTPATKRTRIKFKNMVDENLKFNTYPGVIYQIISNFIFNSKIHGFQEEDIQEQTIVISAHKEKIKEKDNVIIRYSDNGKGISDENMKKIFEPFFTTKRGAGSTGLGMSIVYNLITSTLQGEIKNNSIPDKGVDFEFFIPLTNKSPS